MRQKAVMRPWQDLVKTGGSLQHRARETLGLFLPATIGALLFWIMIPDRMRHRKLSGSILANGFNWPTSFVNSNLLMIQI
ncbi:hypothetical protein XarjCFBP7645_19715 [Xanthomonas arboricola]|uniref:Uncharacterized protein n=1 Tax=Xanthomonas arboricola TaxID=56448 RepID=A0A2S7AC04_9XANT|nr:hypothetical protein XarjCFBP7645_19715 [Xanthomonas arboricola]